jgi:hypothetical protein
VEGELLNPPSLKFSEVFEECFPYYLSIGMSSKDFWEGDCTLVIAYRKAEMLRRQRENTQAWYQGAYVYNAICAASPLLHAFAKEGTTAYPYVKRPFPLTQKEQDERDEEEKIESVKMAAESFRLYAAEKNKELGGGRRGY